MRELACAVHAARRALPVAPPAACTAPVPIPERRLHKELQAVFLQQPPRNRHRLRSTQIRGEAVCCRPAATGTPHVPHTQLLIATDPASWRPADRGRPDAAPTLIAQLMAGAPVANSGMWLLLRAFHAILAL